MPNITTVTVFLEYPDDWSLSNNWESTGDPILGTIADTVFTYYSKRYKCKKFNSPHSQIWVTTKLQRTYEINFYYYINNRICKAYGSISIDILDPNGLERLIYDLDKSMGLV